MREDHRDSGMKLEHDVAEAALYIIGFVLRSEVGLTFNHACIPRLSVFETKCRGISIVPPQSFETTSPSPSPTPHSHLSASSPSLTSP